MRATFVLFGGAVMLYCSLAMSCVSTTTSDQNALMGLWEYELEDGGGIFINGFFTIEQSVHQMTIFGQAYFANVDDNPWSLNNFRGIWSGVFLSNSDEKNYVLRFSMHGNPFDPKTAENKPYDGTIFFEHDKDFLIGHFDDDDVHTNLHGIVRALKLR